MRTALLRGRDFTRLGAVAAFAEARVAITLSRGGAAKTYGHTDPNEDASAFALTDHAWLAAVADGHWGHGGAELALERILERHAPRWMAPSTIALAERWESEAPEVVLDLNRTLLTADGGGELVGRTTLALCLVRPLDGWWSGLAVGDSHVFRVEQGRVSEHCVPRPTEIRYLGDAALDRSRVERAFRGTVEHGVTTGAIVLATDGLSETGIGVSDPAAAVADAIAAARRSPDELRPLATARGLAERALAAQRANRAGDNVATACLWLED